MFDVEEERRSLKDKDTLPYCTTRSRTTRVVLIASPIADNNSWQHRAFEYARLAV